MSACSALFHAFSIIMLPNNVDKVEGTILVLNQP